MNKRKNSRDGFGRFAPAQPAEERFWDNVQKTDGCWLWTGYVHPSGYGEFYVGRQTIAAHRWSYEHSIAPIPDDKQVDHVCRNRACVRPDHLRPATRSGNSQNRKRQVNNTSGYVGVHMDKRTGRWLARVALARRNRYTGTHDTPEGAAAARDELARELHGEFFRPTLLLDAPARPDGHDETGQ